MTTVQPDPKPDPNPGASSESAADRPIPFADWPRPLAFVLSGGGSFGPVQVGMLRALAEHGVEPDLIIGSSVGSLHGAMIATGREDVLDQLHELWGTLDRRAVFGRRRDVARSLIRRRTLSDFQRLETLFETYVGVENFEGLAVPFAAVATDVLTGEPELLRSGPLRPALMASSAVPGIFPPVEIDGRFYVDGGVTANVPVRQAVAFGARSIVSLDATPPVVASAVPTSLVGSLLHSAALMLRSQRSNAVDELTNRYPIAVLPSAIQADHGTFNFDRSADLLIESHRLSSERLAHWRTLTPDRPSGTPRLGRPTPHENRVDVADDPGRRAAPGRNR